MERLAEEFHRRPWASSAWPVASVFAAAIFAYDRDWLPVGILAALIAVTLIEIAAGPFRILWWALVGGMLLVAAYSVIN